VNSQSQLQIRRYKLSFLTDSGNLKVELRLCKLSWLEYLKIYARRETNLMTNIDNTVFLFLYLAREQWDSNLWIKLGKILRHKLPVLATEWSLNISWLLRLVQSRLPLYVQLWHLNFRDTKYKPKFPKCWMFWICKQHSKPFREAITSSWAGCFQSVSTSFIINAKNQLSAYDTIKTAYSIAASYEKFRQLSLQTEGILFPSAWRTSIAQYSWLPLGT